MKERVYLHVDSGRYERHPGIVGVLKCENGDFEITVRSFNSVSTGVLRLTAERYDDMIDQLREEQRRRRAPKWL